MKKKFLTFLGISLSLLINAQVGIYTSAPQGVFHIDGTKDNPLTGIPDTSQSANDVVVTKDGSLGIGTITPLAKVDINGTTRIRSIPIASGPQAVNPLYSDENGVVTKAVSNTYGTVIYNSTTVASSATATLLAGIAEGIYKIAIITVDGCSQFVVAEYYFINFSFNSNYSIKGINGLSSESITNVKEPTFIETNRTTTGTTWSGHPPCGDGGDSTSLNYTLTLPSAGVIDITNHGNISRTYSTYVTSIK